MTAWVEAGQDPALFWHLTPREIQAVFAGVEARMIREHNGRAWHAWHVAALGRAKKMPKLKDMMHGEKPASQRRMTPEQMEAVTRSWLAGRRKR